jgi:uncharacterized protein (DUF2236 family)
MCEISNPPRIGRSIAERADGVFQSAGRPAIARSIRLEYRPHPPEVLRLTNRFHSSQRPWRLPLSLAESPLAGMEGAHPTSSRDPRAAARAAGRRLRRQLATAEDAGYFGPGSTMWLLHREAVLGLGLGRALLLQLAHPWVAQAVADHSPFQTRPLARLIGTITAAELLVFGSREQAAATAAQLRRIHAPVRGTLRETVGGWHAGTTYSAENPEALLWVLLTLLDTSIRIYEAALGALTDETVRSYLAEGARLGEMLGVPASTVPTDRAALDRYMSTMIADGTVAVSPTARRVARALLDARVLPGPAWRIYRRLTRAVASATLPEALRAQYGSILPPRRPRLSRIGGCLSRLVLPRLPDGLRLDPLAATAIRREMRRASSR